MAENRKKQKNVIIALSLAAAVVVVGILIFMASRQNNQGSMVGYWTPGNNCDQRFFELTTDFKFFQWKWEKKWDGYGRDPDVKPSNYAFTGKNEITISGFDRKGMKQEFTGNIERISDVKIKIVNVKVTRDNQTVKDAPAEMTLTRCDENIAEQLKK